ncbi:MAG TPA: thiamine phosphate synthase [Rhizomicrobium sp.]|jgi:thiamine-phosphate pyrophosphorylase|nr:thiamine phosphate synthase [Rhizomicrobium sp.]
MLSLSKHGHHLSDCRLYLISPPKLSPANFVIPLREALDGGDVASFQLRLKHVSDDEIRRACDFIRPIVQAYGTAFILNDRPDLAAELGCDGVHIGQEDATFTEARAALPTGIVGVTCHNSRHLAMEAGEAGADYVAFGAFFPTATKEAKTQADIALLRAWAEDMVVPVVAIGGITVANAPPLVEAGADFLAVASGVWEYADGPESAVRAFNTLFSA